MDEEEELESGGNWSIFLLVQHAISMYFTGNYNINDNHWYIYLNVQKKLFKKKNNKSSFRMYVIIFWRKRKDLIAREGNTRTHSRCVANSQT